MQNRNWEVLSEKTKWPRNWEWGAKVSGCGNAGGVYEGCGIGSYKHTKKEMEQRRAKRTNQVSQRRAGSMVWLKATWLKIKLKKIGKMEWGGEPGTWLRWRDHENAVVKWECWRWPLCPRNTCEAARGSDSLPVFPYFNSQCVQVIH